MRLRNIPGSRETIASKDYVITEPESQKGHWADCFGNTNPIYIEIGMGKGQFIMENARRHPEINYIGIEKYSSVLLRATEKLDEDPLPNVRFIRFDAEELLNIFAPEEIDRIYLNFSDPWPKDRHAKRRLTSRQYLARYQVILKKDAHIEFKTDNRPLFDFSVDEVKESNWTTIAITYDLHHDEALNEGNIMTEYEERFSSMGNPIHKIIMKP